MIRGVNKNIIEISDTGNECFERAILFVRPCSKTTDSEHLFKRAGDYLSGLRLRPRFYLRGRLWRILIGFGGAAAAGATATFLLLR